MPANSTRREPFTKGWCDMPATNPHAPRSFSDEDSISLCETLDRVLNKGVVVAGEVVISVADIDLIYLGLQLMLTSVETARTAGLGLTNVLNERPALRQAQPATSSVESGGMSLSSAARSCP